MNKFETVSTEVSWKKVEMIHSLSKDEIKHHYFQEDFNSMKLWQMIQELKAVTTFWPMPNDVREEEEGIFRGDGGAACKPPWEILIEAAHRLFVTGHSGGNGSWAPADLNSGFCWISNCSV
jgi:hypothetical protein